MKNLLPVIGTIAVNSLGLALLVYTGTRTVDFIGLTLPAGQQPLAYIGLAAFDVGLLGWLAFFLFAARGPWQRGTALLMIGVSLLGVVIAFLGDTLYRAGERGTLSAADPALILTVVYSMAAVIAANIVALITVHVTDPAALRRAAEQDAQDQIDEATTQQINARAGTLAAQLAPARAAAWVDNLRGAQVTESEALSEPEPVVIVPDLARQGLGSNGHHPELPLAAPPKSNGRRPTAAAPQE